MQRKTLHTIALTAALAAVCLLSGCVVVINGSGESFEYGNCFTQARVEKKITLTEPMEPGMVFKAAGRDGAMRITGADTDRATVEVTLIAHAPDEEKARQLLEKAGVELVRSGDTLSLNVIRPSLPPRHSLDLAFTATLPRSASLNLTSDDGQVNVSGIRGGIRISSNDGGIDLADIGGPEAAHVLRTDDGAVHARSVSGRMDIQTNDGSVTVDGLPQDVKVNSDDGRIALLQVRGNVAVQTNDGPIRVQYVPDAPPAPRIELSTDDGRIELITPRDFSAAVDIQTDDGSIKTDLPITLLGQIKPNRLQGRIAAGEGALKIRSNDGPVSIQPAKQE